MRILWRVLVGVLGGATAFTVIGFMQAISTGLTSGVVLGLDLRVVAVIVPSSSVLVGVIAGVSVGLAALLLHQVLSGSTLASASITIIVLGAIGSSLFPADFTSTLGTAPWVLTVAIAGSQSLAVWVLAGLTLAASLSAVRGGRLSPPSETDAPADADAP